MSKKKVYIIPCSGIGKVFGSIGREAAYIVVNELAKGKTKNECLPLIVKKKKEVIDALKNNKVIVIDGCPLKCSYNDVKEAIGRAPDGEFLSTEIVKDFREIKPETTIIPLGENAKILSRKLAEKINDKVEELLKEEDK